MQFKDIVGQRFVINHLTESIDEGRVPHAQLLVGETTSGALPVAIAYAQYLGCKNRRHYDDWNQHDGLRADSCGECATCKKYQQLVHPDLHLLFPNATTNEVKGRPSSELMVAAFRDFLNETRQQGSLDDWLRFSGINDKISMIREEDAAEVMRVLGLKSYEGGWKVLIVWMAEKLNPIAANKLLKALEEPTEQTLFLLVAQSTDHFLRTVLSRTQQISLPPLPPQLRPASQRDEEQRMALWFVTWMRQLFRLNMSSLSAWVKEMDAAGRETQRRFLLYAQDTVRACLMVSEAGVPLDRDFGDEKFNASFPAMVTRNNVEGLCAAFDETIRAITQNARATIAFMELSFRISKLLKRR
ncbi:MAG: hypothetical protein SPJ13_04995 [Bacteroidales bacterium]|nr:hypothetical protein [Bacteroidales bacterium]